jgi:uncharacterized protein (TIGR03083 family)
MAERKEQIVKRLIEEGAKAAAYLRTLRAADWEQAVYTTGGRWRVREVLCHFVSAEHAVAHFGGDILRGGQGAPDGFVIDEFNETQVGGMADREPEGLIAEFEQGRAATVALAQTMSAADLERVGRHPWFGRAPLEDMLKLAYRHTMIHLRDVRRALETGQPVPHQEVSPPSAA